MTSFNKQEVVFTTEIEGIKHRVFPKYLGFRLTPRDARDRVTQAYLSKGDPFVKITTAEDRDGDFEYYLVGRGTKWKQEKVDVPEGIAGKIDSLNDLYDSDNLEEVEVSRLEAELRNYFSKG